LLKFSQGAFTEAILETFIP